MQYIGSYKNPADIATKQNVDDAVADKVVEMIVNVTAEYDDSGTSATYTADKTFDEISSAIQSGKYVRVIMDGDTEFCYSMCWHTLSDPPTISKIFFVNNYSYTQSTLMVIANNTWDIINVSIPNLGNITTGSIVKRSAQVRADFVDAVPGTDYMAPVPVTTEDNGKVLAVTNGAWGAQPLTIEMWIFTMEDGSEVTKTIVTGIAQIV